MTWMSLLAGLSVMNFPHPYQEIATLIAWSIFLVFAMYAALMAVSNFENPTHEWTGITIFAISIITILTVAEALNAETPGTIVLRIFGSESTIPPPSVYSDVQPPESSPSTSFNQWLAWEYYTSTISSVVDLAAASIVTMVGGVIGARYARGRGTTDV